MANNSQERKSLGLDRAAHRWLKRAAEHVGLSVKEALQDAIRVWAHLIEETEADPEEVIRSAVTLRGARDRLEKISVAISAPQSDLPEELAEIREAVGPTVSVDVGLQADVDDSPDLYSTNWERTKHTAAKVGPGSYRLVNRIADERDRSAKSCVEEAVQLWCILQNEHRDEVASRKAREARAILEEI